MIDRPGVLGTPTSPYKLAPAAISTSAHIGAVGGGRKQPAGGNQLCSDRRPAAAPGTRGGATDHETWETVQVNLISQSQVPMVLISEMFMAYILC